MNASIADMIRVRSDMKSVSFIIHPKSLLPNVSDDVVDRLRIIKNDGFDISIIKQAGEGQEGTVLI